MIASQKWTIAGGLLAVGIASALGFWFLTPGPKELRLPGIVETQEVRLGSKIGGRISKIAVREGDVVKAGQPLVFLEAPELDARRQQLQASYEAAQAQLAKAENGPRPEEKAAAKAAVEVARAKFERLKAGYRPEEVAIALAESKSTQFELERAQKEWQREERLNKNGASSAALTETAWAGFARLQEQAKLTQARWKMLASGNRDESKAEAAAELAKAEANWLMLDRGTRTEEIAEAKARVAEIYAKIREIDVQLLEAIVVAPDAALVETIAVRGGDIASPNQPLVRVLLADDLWVKAYVPETQLGKVRLGGEVKLTVDSYPGRTFRGNVTFIASISEFTPRNVQTVDERHHQVFAFKARVTEAAHVFKSGMAVDVILPLAQTPEE
jgi:HlyD family secretion protein